MQTIRLDKERKLEFNVDAFLKLEEAMGESIFPVLMRMEKGTPPTFKFIILMIWAGLLKHEGLKFEEVKSIVPLNRLHDTIPLITKAMNESLASGEEVGEKKKKGKLSKA